MNAYNKVRFAPVHLRKNWCFSTTTWCPVSNDPLRVHTTVSGLFPDDTLCPKDGHQDLHFTKGERAVYRGEETILKRMHHYCCCCYCYYYLTYSFAFEHLLHARDKPEDKLKHRRDWRVRLPTKKREEGPRDENSWGHASWIRGTSRELSYWTEDPHLEQLVECSWIFSADLIFVASSFWDRSSCSQYPWHSKVYKSNVSPTACKVPLI